MRTEIVTGILVTCAMMAACALIPILGLVGTVFLPIPIMVYRARLGRQPTAIIAAAALGFVGLLGGSWEILFFGEFLLIGFVLGELLPAGISIEKSALIACAAVFGTGIAGLALHGLMSGMGLFEVVSEAARHNLELTAALYRQMGVSEEQITFLEEAMPVIQNVLVGMMPALVVASTLMVVWVSLLVARPVFRRYGLAPPDYGPLDRWKAPEPLVWAAIASGVLLLLPGFGLKMLGLNGLIVLMIVYFFQGIAVVAFHLGKKQVPRLVRVMLYFIIAVQQLVMLVVIGVGFFDTWFNFRKLGRPPASA
ncbi:MAG: YybS family protein [Desulfobacterales bacterium]